MDIFYPFSKVFKSCFVNLVNRRHTLIHRSLLLPTSIKRQDFFIVGSTELFRSQSFTQRTENAMFLLPSALRDALRPKQLKLM